MICQNCGTNNPDGVSFCVGCGGALNPYAGQYQAPPSYQQPGQYDYSQPGQYNYGQPYSNGYPDQTADIRTANTLGIVSLICGCLTIIEFLLPAIFFLLPIAAWVCGGIGISKANNALRMYPGNAEATKAKSMSIWGIIAASVITGLTILIALIVLIIAVLA